MPLSVADIRFVYFDLDDTLLDHQSAQDQAIGDIHAAYPGFQSAPLDHVRATYHQINTDVWIRYADGELTKAQTKRTRFARLLDAYAIIDVDPDTLSDFYLSHYANHWHYCTGAERAFHTIAERFPVGVLTNGLVNVQHAKLARFPDMRDRLGALVISEDIGYLKPHPQVFAHATQVAGVATSEILYVGDSYRSDVRGGIDAGWQVAWYTGNLTADRRAHAVDSDVFRFDDWPALLRVLGLQASPAATA